MDLPGPAAKILLDGKRHIPDGVDLPWSAAKILGNVVEFYQANPSFKTQKSGELTAPRFGRQSLNRRVRSNDSSVLRAGGK